MTIGYVTIGALDSEKSGKFYDAVLGAVGYARAAQVRKGTGSLGGQNTNALHAVQQGFAAGAELGQHSTGDDFAFSHFGDLID